MSDGSFELTVSVEPLSSLAAARHRLADQLRQWHCANLDEVLLVFSELLTNAILHAQTTARVLTTINDGVIRLEIHDGAASIPPRQATDPSQTGGFGLHIVEHLSNSWGWHTTSTGKLVWCTMPCNT
jgi:anti-sigma regulatory factor (Ser/Thr protein kinase)